MLLFYEIFELHLSLRNDVSRKKTTLIVKKQQRLLQKFTRKVLQIFDKIFNSAGLCFVADCTQGKRSRKGCDAYGHDGAGVDGLIDAVAPALDVLQVELDLVALAVDVLWRRAQGLIKTTLS